MTPEERYPNMAACAQGCTSGKWSEWPVLRAECRQAIDEIERLQKLLAETEAAYVKDIEAQGVAKKERPDEAK